MVEWDKEVFEKEYGDMSWFKGKQSKHIKELQRAKKRNSLVLTLSQREIFDKVQIFVLQQRDVGANSKTARLELLNEFPARDREFINTLGADLHLELAWDEYDENDRNIVTFRVPGAHEEPQADVENGDGGNDDEWISDEEDEEARNAVDRVLQKYRNAKVLGHASEDFDDRYEQAIKEKMDDWKRSYYTVRLNFIRLGGISDFWFRTSWEFVMTTRRIWANLRIVMWRDCNG
jgi:5'-3' exoribonuclease 1